MQNNFPKSFVSWRTASSPRPRLNSSACFLPKLVDIHLIQKTRFTQTAKLEFETSFYWFWFYVLLHSSWWTCVHQCFAHYHSIAPQKTSNLGGLSLVLSWKPCLFYCPFCYLQNVDFEGSHKKHSNRCVLNTIITDYLLSSIQQSL